VSAILGIKHATPEMRKNGGGSIISTASVAGLSGGYGPHAYSAAKAAVVNLTRSVALEVAKYKIRVNCICPAGINTPILSILTTDANKVEQFLAAAIPLKRSGHSEDIANMALFLAGDESQFITGQALVVDGVSAGPQSPLADTNVYVGPSFTVGKH
jgi:NAD(P)-dependent dehydrogenase (short-subunit alcohol dehydrogenase family)